MSFIDYPDHLPRGPLSPEAAAIFERFKEIAARLDIKIVLYKPAPPSPLDLDIVLPSLSAASTGPIAWTVLKPRAPKEPSP